MIGDGVLEKFIYFLVGWLVVFGWVARTEEEEVVVEDYNVSN